ncbi:hypothetical protein ABZ137_38040 [Streptomyces bobili]|uniref:hypothetical protein n=1 Tax=Streptomyces bobili TaxID=67280 RepID=UPI0033A33D8E
MEDITAVVSDLLEQLAVARDVPVDAPPDRIVVSSLDQMRFLVGLEERLDAMLDVGDTLPFDLTSREALVKSVLTLLEESGYNG